MYKLETIKIENKKLGKVIEIDLVVDYKLPNKPMLKQSVVECITKGGNQ
jgi:hypothetical protein